MYMCERPKLPYRPYTVRIKLESSLKSSPDFKSPSALRHSRGLRWDATADSRPPQMYDGLWADALRR